MVEEGVHGRPPPPRGNAVGLPRCVRRGPAIFVGPSGPSPLPVHAGRGPGPLRAHGAVRRDGPPRQLADWRGPPRAGGRSNGQREDQHVVRGNVRPSQGDGGREHFAPHLLQQDEQCVLTVGAARGVSAVALGEEVQAQRWGEEAGVLY